MKKQGLVIVHTGNGKGKTTAALGLAIRAWGDGFRVIILTLAGAGAAALIRPVDENNPAGTSADENAEREKTLL